MIRKASRPALYEKMQLQRGGVETSNEADADSVERAAPSAIPQWLSAGRVIRMPIGYIFVAGAFMVLCVALSYSIGFKRGHFIAGQQTSGDQPFLPPRALEGGPSAATDHSLVDSDEAELERESRPVTYSQPRLQTQDQWEPISADIRLKGENYFVLAETNHEGATRLADFCRSQGLETYVISRKNVQSRFLVYALPGFKDGERSTPVVKSLEQSIHRIGDSWKAHKRGDTNLHDAYPKLYDGKPW